MSLERLDKLVSSAGSVSRTDAKILIKSGRVTVDDATVKDCGFKADAEKNSICIDGEPIVYKRFVYYMLNKPKGVLSASSDKSRQTVVDIIAAEVKRNGLFPVGRLDKDTTGFLIVTDDGDFGHKVISPKSFIEKEYHVFVDKPVTDSDIEALEKGVTLTDGTVCRPARVSVLSDDRLCISMIITEGKYHEIKRMLGVVCIGVNELHRHRIGKVTLDLSLKQGEYREMTSEELLNVLK